MKKLIFVFFISAFLISCEDPDAGSENLTKSELLALHGWQLDKYTDTQGNMITSGALSSGANGLFQLVFEFRNNQEVRGLNKSDKSLLTKGTWTLDEDNTLAIDIPGLDEEFRVVNITKTSMTLSSSEVDDYVKTSETEVYLVFSTFDL